MTYSFFELRNFFKEKAIIVLFLIFLGITIAPQFLLTPDENFDKGYLYALEGSIEMQKEILDAGDLPPHVAENIAEELKLNEMLLSKIKNNDLTEALKAELAKETFTLKGVENGSISGPTLVEQKLLVAKLEYLVKNKLLKVSDDTAVMPAVNYLMSSMRPYMPIFLVVSLILSYAYSLEKRRKTIDFLNVIPVSLKRISITKFLLFTSLTSLLVLVSFLLNYIIAMAKNGTGSWKYPIVVTPDGQTVEVMTAQTFVLKEMCLLLLILLFLSILSFFIQLYSGNILVNLGILLGLVALSQYQLPSDGLLGKLAVILPFSYMNFSTILTRGETFFAPLKNNELTFENGVGVLCCYIFLLVLLSAIRLKWVRRM